MPFSFLYSSRYAEIRECRREINYLHDMKRNLFYGLLVTVGLQTLFACADGNLAKDMAGRWQGERIARDETGTPHSQKIGLEFRHVDGGESVFTETARADVEERESGLVVRYTVSSSISGRWSVESGNLSLTYDLNTLEVAVDSLKGDMESLEGFETINQVGMLEILSLLSTGESLISEEKLEKMYYEALRAEYVEDNNKAVAATNVKVEGNTLSFLFLLDGRESLRLYRITD